MSANQPQTPVACSLAPTELTDRRAVWEQLSRRALRERRLIPGGMQLVFEPQEGVEHQLQELAHLEGQCCSFADWKVRRRSDVVVLDVTAAPEAVDAVRALFDGSEQVPRPAR